MGTDVDHPGGVAVLEVVQHGRLVQVRQHGHVLDPVELGGVHRVHVLWLHHQRLQGKGDGAHLGFSVRRCVSTPRPGGGAGGKARLTGREAGLGRLLVEEKERGSVLVLPLFFFPSPVA